MARLLFKDENGTLHTVYGVRGIRGDGIADVELNERYELVFTTDDGIEFTTGSIRGPQGAPGRDGLPDGDDGNVILHLMDDDNGEYPVAFRQTAFDVGVEEVTEQLGFDEFTYNPSTKTMSADKVVAQVSDSISAVTSVTEGNLESGDTLRDLFGKIRRKFGEIKDFVKNDLAQAFTNNDPNTAASAALVSQLKTEVDGKSALGHKHDAADVTTGILAVARGGTGNGSVDTTPTAGSTKMVTSGGLKTAFDGKSDTGHKHSASDITSGVLAPEFGGTGGAAMDTTPTAGSSNGVTSGAVATALAGKSDTGHKHAASDITSGILAIDRGGTGVSALSGTDYNTARFRGIYANTSGMTAGSSALANGVIYLQYE